MSFWLAAVALLVVAGCGNGPGGLDWRELADDPVLQLDLAGTRAGEVHGITGSGESGGPLSRSSSSAWREWTTENAALEPTLVEAVANAVDVGARLRELDCKGRITTFYGTKSVEIDGEPVAAEVEILTDTQAQPPTVRIELSSDGNSPPLAASPPEERAVVGECSAALVDALRLSA